MKPSNRSGSFYQGRRYGANSGVWRSKRQAKDEGAQWNCELLYFLRSFFFATRPKQFNIRVKPEGHL